MPTRCGVIFQMTWKRSDYSLNRAQAGPGGSVLQAPTAVDAMSAVTCREEGTSENRMFIVEDGSNPRATLHELSRESDLVEHFWGKPVGGPYAASAQRYTVLAIENKIAYRARHCLQDFPSIFGLGGGIQRFSIADKHRPGTDQRLLVDMRKVLSAQTSVANISSGFTNRQTFLCPPCRTRWAGPYSRRCCTSLALQSLEF